jgi:hypothetical protein
MRNDSRLRATSPNVMLTSHLNNSAASADQRLSGTPGPPTAYTTWKACSQTNTGPSSHKCGASAEPSQTSL